MSDHALPPDPSSWPKDPYRLLGVSRGVTPKDLRRAYLRLVRDYKPEHAPDEFRLIREAYESLQASAAWFGQFLSTTETPDETEPVAEVPETWSAAPTSDPWKIAREGNAEAAYRELVGSAEGGGAREEVYLQLYWLLVVRPDLDPTRTASDWLVNGLRALGARGQGLRELLVREAESDPESAIGDRFEPLLAQGAPIDMLADVVGCRWRAARLTNHWRVIAADLENLRTRVASADEDVWARILIAAAVNLAWDAGNESEIVRRIKREVDQLSHLNLTLADDLLRIEYAQKIRTGLLWLGLENEPVRRLNRLLSLSWDHDGPEARALLRDHLRRTAALPLESFRGLDSVVARAPAVLGRLLELPGELGIAIPPAVDPRDFANATFAVVEFLATASWRNYPPFRVDMLMFCLREMVSPALVGTVLGGQPDYVLPDGQHLAHVVASDWPLVYVYRAAEISWA